MKHFVLDYEKTKEELEEIKLAIKNTHFSLAIFEGIVRKKKRDIERMEKLIGGLPLDH